MKKKRILLGLVLSTAFIGAAIGMTSCAGGENPNASTSEPATTQGGESSSQADPYADYVKISNVEEFLAFRALENTSKKYVLTADIDLEGVELEATAVYLRGTFDGNGHVIKNAYYVENASNKSGILCREIIGGTVTNVKFLNCVASVANETIGIVSGMVSGNVTFSKLEFIACTASCNNYAGMLTGRISSTGTKLVADQITTKNGCRTSITSYGGFLLSDIAGGESATKQNEIIFTNMDIAGEIKGGNGNGGFISGRIRNNTKFTVENTIIRDAQLGSAEMGLIAGGGTTNGKNVNVNYKNVAILSTNATKFQSLGDGMSADSLGSGEFLTTYSLENVFIPTGTSYSLGDATGTIKAKSEITALTADVTPAWLTETLHLDFAETWKTEGENDTKYRLIAASTNVKSANATLVSLKATTTNAPTRFTQGTDFTSEGLVVAATYSDDVQLILNPTDYTVDSSAFDKTTAGTYSITVKATEKNAAGADVTASYNVILAVQTGFVIDSQFTKLVYTKGESLNLANLLVYSTWTDEVKTKEDKTNYSVDETAFNKNAAGGYNLSISMDGFNAQTLKVSVIDSKPTVVDDKIYINVDGSSNIAVEGTKVNGVETFTTITNAVDYLVACNFDASVDKVIYVANGTYTEKITIPATLENLKIIGESRENTKIEYDAVEGTINPLTNAVYKFDCATLDVRAKGFGLENITVKNTFDYINESSKYGDPQGFALAIKADGAVINNVYLYGNQDTFYFKSTRTYVKDSRIDGNVDFIFGENDGLAYFDNCTIHAVYRGDTSNTGYATAMKGDTGETKPNYGYIFNNCTFEADSNVNEGSMSLGRPWGGGATVAMINCSFTAAYSKLGYTSDDKTKSRWFSMSGNSPVNADFCEYGSTGAGSITEAVNGGKVLTEAQAANYTAANLFATTNGGVTWSTEFDYAAALTALQAMATTTNTTGITLKSKDDTDDTDNIITLEIEKNKTQELLFEVTPWNANNKNVEVSYSIDGIAEYSDGTIKGLNVGTTVVTFTIGEFTASATVEVVTPSGQYNVKFYNGDTLVHTSTAAEGDAITYPSSNPTKDGWTFVRWYSDDKFTTPFTATETPNEDMNIYARFYENDKDGVVYASTATQLLEGIEANKVIYLTQDIDFDGNTYAGRAGNFNGSCYGFGYAIKNWTVSSAAAQASFFGQVYGGTLDSIVFKNCHMTTDNNYGSILTSGAYCDEVINCIEFDNCSVKNATAAGTNAYAGLLAGAGNLGTYGSITDDELKITNISIINSEVAGSQYSGGLFGYLNKGSISVTNLKGDIKFTSVGSNNKNSGGIIGWGKDHNFKLVNALINVTIDGGSQNMGGIIGGLQYNAATTKLTVENAIITVNSTNAPKVTGGIVGIGYASSETVITDTKIIMNVVSTGESIGGVAGRSAGTLTLNSVEITGTIGANYRSGSVVGYANAAGATTTLTNVYAHDLTITNSNADASGKVFVGKNDGAEISYTTCIYKNVTITLSGTEATLDQGSEAQN